MCFEVLPKNSFYGDYLRPMSIWRVLLCIIFPPLAVLDKGCGSVLIVVLLTLAGWVPGVIGALVINKK